MENLLQGIPKVCIFLDDILITGATEAHHNLYDVLFTYSKLACIYRKKNVHFYLLRLNTWDTEFPEWSSPYYLYIGIHKKPLCFLVMLHHTVWVPQTI